jgi:hypothetical protein
MRQTVQPLRPSSPLPQTTRLSAIRQSAYKLQRSTSHRKDHSLERKPPLIIKPKLTPRQTPAQPRCPSPHRPSTAHKDGSNLLAFFETAETETKEDGKNGEEGCFRTEARGKGAGEEESFVGEAGWKETQQIGECLTAIEQAVAKIRQTGHFLAQTSQMRQLLIDMR